MSVKKKPGTLLDLSLHALCHQLLQTWRESYELKQLPDYSKYFVNELSVTMPISIYEKVFHRMLETQLQDIQAKKSVCCTTVLMNVIISPKLQKLNLHPLRNITKYEVEYLHDSFIKNLPNLVNLTEICLRTNDFGYTTALCTDAMLKQIGFTCSKLISLDVSYNSYVTNHGIWFLIPCDDTLIGCPELTMLSVDECDITIEGALELLNRLPKLKYLGYEEIGQSLLMLHEAYLPNKHEPLQLTACNNLGTHNRYREEYHELEFNSTLASIIPELCPKLYVLKIRVSDSAVWLLHELTNITTLELLYDVDDRSYSPSPGRYTAQYLQVCGAQLESLSFICNIFSSQYVKIVCGECINLKKLSIQCNIFNYDNDLSRSDRANCALTKLEKFVFKMGCDSSPVCHIPSDVITYVVHESQVLTDIDLTMRNSLFSDSYIDQLFTSITTSKIKSINIQDSTLSDFQSPLSLTMVSVNALIGMCPELELLGKLLLWTVSEEELNELKSRLQVTNSALVVI